MHPVILMIVFLVHGRPIGAQLIGSTETAPQCQEMAAHIIKEKAGEEPNGSVPFPVCIDMTNAPDTQASPVAPERKGPSTKL